MIYLSPPRVLREVKLFLLPDSSEYLTVLWVNS